MVVAEGGFQLAHKQRVRRRLAALIEGSTSHLFQPSRADQMPESPLNLKSLKADPRHKMLCVHCWRSSNLHRLLHIELAHPTAAPAAARTHKWYLLSGGFVAREQQEASHLLEVSSSCVR